MSATTTTPQITSGDRLGLTLFLALVLHGLIILGITFSQEKRITPSAKTLEIILVQTRSKNAPEDADYLAQASQEGGGENEELLRPQDTQSSLLPAKGEGMAPAPIPEIDPVPTPELVEPQPEPSPQPYPEPIQPTPPIPQVKPASQPVKQPTVITTVSKKAKPRTAPKTTVKTTKSAKKPSASQLISRSLEIASLTAELSENIQAYSQRKKHTSITANTREYKYASYLDAWRKKIERIGNLNYPDEARRNQLSGTLLLDVALNPDGTIESINLLRSSGYRVLDDAAIRIVELAAPFARFPDNIREETDILHITRTWQFADDNRFSSR
ncbi:hypothetical protein BOW53_01790 [Solemya pervernicosa gill symbiont]|uniref:TonB C-terminal domain-containing protein n=2 Tax=Gammaproteobacteria incertae sedis TaxID=118884 RepID=A0A1T2LAF5_9GAMM|nr:energy transducer TonB [Candidatus Reidiella endopervernicosa]OOZ41926.1 hypothetical protein BOW53_01790 [Solemya pervernicosa gill symbiont]QKQ24892.1 energy transducer TonB [Candidatus Reidiella endopervernicosa]